ncbi:unnamed protein product [Aureobasidium uvarum]|uniref:Uncharacterized protein n=1 Tax=Aureobasidium uvarum TaxID=2773716 RepID=A0A9N8KJP8_9PEZI|nr:unnamed protein product [Aureobasidium uvarum]
MAQYYSVPGQYPQEARFEAPLSGHWQDYASPMSPPPYPSNHEDYAGATLEPKMPCPMQTSMQYPRMHLEPPHQQSFATHQSTSHSPHHEPLSIPVVIPQIQPGANNPFIRAYSASLAAHGIDLTAFLTFLDTLNVCLANTPPLQVLDLAGGIVGMVPHHIPALIGGSLQALAKVGSAVTSKTRVAALLRDVNSNLFNPRGLKCEICDTATLKQKLGLNATAPLLAELGEAEMHMSIQERRLHALAPYTTPLSFNIPEAHRQTNTIDRLAAKQLHRQMAKAEQKALEARQKGTEKKDKRASKEDKKAEKRKDRGKEEEKKKKGKDKDDKESKAAEKLLWLFVGRA